jgi:hypothetical protein
MAKNKSEITIASDEANLIPVVPEGVNPLDAFQARRAGAKDFDGQTIERIVPMQEGDSIRGVFQGPGEPLEMADANTGEIRVLGTWRVLVAHLPGGGQAIAVLISSSQLEREFARFKREDGTWEKPFITVVRGPQIDTRGGRRVTQYLVGRTRGELGAGQ